MAIAKVIEISASSKKSFEDALETGIKEAAKTVDNIRGAWVKEQKVVVDGEKITEYRINLEITFVLKR